MGKNAFFSLIPKPLRNVHLAYDLPAFRIFASFLKFWRKHTHTCKSVAVCTKSTRWFWWIRCAEPEHLNDCLLVAFTLHCLAFKRVFLFAIFFFRKFGWQKPLANIFVRFIRGKISVHMLLLLTMTKFNRFYVDHEILRWTQLETLDLTGIFRLKLTDYFEWRVVNTLTESDFCESFMGNDIPISTNKQTNKFKCCWKLKNYAREIYIRSL